jgi:transaldolase
MVCWMTLPVATLASMRCWSGPICTSRVNTQHHPGKDFKELAQEIFAVLPDGEVSLEVVSTAAEGMIQEAATLLSWAPKVGPPQ